jgi:hypothetical protein
MGNSVNSSVTEGAESRRMPSLSWLAVSIILLGLTLEVSDGHFSAAGIIGLTVTCLAVWRALIAPPRNDEKYVECVLGVGLLLQFGALLARPAGVYFQGGPALLAILPVAVGLMAVLAGTVIARAPLAGRATFPLLLALFALCCIATLLASPNPRIDVFVVQKVSSQTLLHGHNPYSIEIPNVYGNTEFFNPDVADAKVLHFGYNYPPLPLFFTALAQGLVGDVRAAQALALLLAGILLLRAGGKYAPLVALLFLATPRIFFVLEQAWTEPFAVLLLTATVLSSKKRPGLTPILFGLLLALKQYMFILAPLVPLLLGRPFQVKKTLVFLLKAGAVACAVTLPLALLDTQGFYRSVLRLQVVQPFRPDTLSFLGLWTAAGHAPPPVTPFFVVATLLAAYWALRRFPATPQGFAAGAALVLLGFFTFNKQSFCNFYFFIVGALSCALAVAQASSEPAQAKSSPLRSATSANAEGERLASAS